MSVSLFVSSVTKNVWRIEHTFSCGLFSRMMQEHRHCYLMAPHIYFWIFLMVTKIIVIHMLLWTNYTKFKFRSFLTDVLSWHQWHFADRMKHRPDYELMKTFSADCLILTSSKHTRSLICIVPLGGYVIILYVCSASHHLFCVWLCICMWNHL